MDKFKRNINLLPKTELEQTSLGQFLKWALTFGRYIIIATELIVITALFLRFKFDLDLANISTQIAKNQAIITSYQEVEHNVNALNKRLSLIKEIEEDTLLPHRLLTKISQLTPQDVVFNKISLQKHSISLTGSSLSKSGLNTFIYHLRSNDNFSQINLQSVSSKGRKNPEIKFSVSVKVE